MNVILYYIVHYYILYYLILYCILQVIRFRNYAALKFVLYPSLINKQFKQILFWDYILISIWHMRSTFVASKLHLFLLNECLRKSTWTMHLLGCFDIKKSNKVWKTGVIVWKLKVGTIFILLTTLFKKLHS